MTPITALGSRYGIQGALGRSVKRAAASGGWWDLNGTITSCVLAYQPKGAASYAASLVNLTGDTDYDAYEGVAPTWNTSTGWTGNASTMYLKTDYVPPVSLANISIIVRTSTNMNNNSAVFNAQGRADAQSNGTGLGSSYMSGHKYGWGWSGVNNDWMSNDGNAAGVYAMVANNTYKNGEPSSSFSAESHSSGYPMTILARNRGSFVDKYSNITIVAIALYSANLTAQNISDLTTAMNAL